MKATRLILFVLGLLSFGAQVVRHVYVRWFEPTHSVLEKYEAPVRGDIRNSRSLSDLESRYAVELKKTGGHPPSRPRKAHLAQQDLPSPNFERPSRNGRLTRRKFASCGSSISRASWSYWPLGY